jgi:hypothetical protein
MLTMKASDAGENRPPDSESGGHRSGLRRFSRSCCQTYARLDANPDDITDSPPAADAPPEDFRRPPHAERQQRTSLASARILDLPGSI